MPKLLRSLVVCALALALPALAQRQTASIAGSATDASGAPVPGAKVSMKNLATVTALGAGRFQITVTKEGISEISLQVDQSATAMMTDSPLNGRNVLQLLHVTLGTLTTFGTLNQAATRPAPAANSRLLVRRRRLFHRRTMAAP